MKKNKLTKLIKLSNPPIHFLILGLLFSVLSALAGLMIPLIVKNIVENLSNKISINLIIISSITVIGWILCSILSEFSLQYTGLKIVKNIRVKLWDKLINLPITYYDNNQTGEFVSRITNDTMLLKDLVSRQIIEFITDSMVIIGAIIILFTLDIKMTLVIIIGVAICGLLIMPVGEKLYNLSSKEQDEMGDLTSTLTQTLSEIKLIKAYGTEEVEFKKGNNNFDELFNYGVKTAKIQSILEPVIMVLSMMVFIFVIAYGAYRVSVGEISSGSLVAFLLYLFQIIEPVANISEFFADLYKTKGATERIYDILLHEEKEDILSGDDIEDINKIEFKNISYSYDDSELLKDISFDATKGQIVSIVGQSGVGKSTIFSMIEQFISPKDGQIYINDKNINTYNIKSVRKNISYVQQDTPLLIGSVKENITYGLKREVSLQELENVCILSGSYEFINNLPQGFNTIISERGKNLSGGQKQRISIARAILRNPSMILFDEATASLDVESEKIIQQSINKIKKDKIIFVIAHRLSTIMDSDKILVIENGRITGSGNHKELYENHGYYKRLVDKQTN